MAMDSKTETTKLPDMVMCGDHPSFNKAELNFKEVAEDKDKEQPIPLPIAKLSSTSARSMRADQIRRARHSGHELRPAQRGSRLAVAEPPGHSGALVQAALGTFRWPPYLLAVWVLVLVLTHTLHCLVNCLERGLPRLRQLCEYLRSCVETQWVATGSSRLCPVSLAALTTLLYALYWALLALHSVAVWAVEPLAVDDKEAVASVETKVTDYEEANKSDNSIK